MNKRGMETEVLVKIVIVFVVLSVVILFFSGGFRSTGGKLANATEDVTDPVSDVVSAIESGIRGIGGSGDCEVVSESTSSTKCFIEITHADGCSSETTKLIDNMFDIELTTDTWEMCDGKCKLKVTACYIGATSSTFKYDLWEI